MSPSRLSLGVIISCLFLGLLLLATALGDIPWPLSGYYFVISGITFAGYYLDKRAAIADSWRTPEAKLHLLSVCGGWPGALLAQHWLRHKNRKYRFLVVFALTLLLNIAGLVALLVSLPR
ncbi:DUF1294 domain-containing protein [Shewanella sp. NIFS-20-20]|uniref:DUF1294 domain-containing protein n=1 Tax=Shewanella sp. NIFS-20-20 TaxID=2853806 RepID=UPI001C46D696|nr:DUF1294 domain-containing protein [Shewanella sp. NIFS-20-20]MBV7314500.1 DUF1294 domain-containing protein [Shewanella sp. NIFS-20-20]